MPMIYPVSDSAALGNRVAGKDDKSSPFEGARVFKDLGASGKASFVVAPISGRYELFDVRRDPRFAALGIAEDQEEFKKSPNSIKIVSGDLSTWLYGIDASKTGLPPTGDLKQGEVVGTRTGNLSWMTYKNGTKLIDPVSQPTDVGGLVTLTEFENAKGKGTNPDLANTSEDDSSSSGGLGLVLLGLGGLWILGKGKRRGRK